MLQIVWLLLCSSFLCCLLTTCLSKGIQCHVWPFSFAMLANYVWCIAYLVPYLLARFTFIANIEHLTAFSRLDAQYVLDASARFDAGWSVLRSSLQNSTFKLTPVLLLTPGTQHTICWLTPRWIEEIPYAVSAYRSFQFCQQTKILPVSTYRWIAYQPLHAYLDGDISRVSMTTVRPPNADCHLSWLLHWIGSIGPLISGTVKPSSTNCHLCQLFCKIRGH